MFANLPVTGRLMSGSCISSHMALFLIRYGEIALKSPRVRSRFERVLGSNITSRFVKSGRECRMEMERGRIFLWADDMEYAEWVLSRTFGIVSFSQVIETTSEKEDIYSHAIELSKPFFKQGIRFCIRTRRSGDHKYTSMELARDTGSAVFLAYQHLNPKVDLTHPELEIFVDVRHNKSYIYTGSTPGPGGMPLGTQGRVLGVVKEKRDIAACWLIMKRGSRVIVATSDESLAEPLASWDPELKVLGLDGADLSYLARSRRADGLCLGWGIEEFDRHGAEMVEMGIPAFYPIIGMAKGEIGELLANISG
jgi:thiamine biosynthesis protein ThiI